MQGKVAFEEAIELSTRLIKNLNSHSISEPDFMREAELLLRDVASARGFFVALLTGDWPFGDEIPQTIVEAIRRTAIPSYDLLIKNIVMSTAARVEHLRAERANQAQGSLVVTKRCLFILKELKDDDRLKELLMKITVAIETKNGSESQKSFAVEPGEYIAFLERWKYDARQLRESLSVLMDLMNDLDMISS